MPCGEIFAGRGTTNFSRCAGEFFFLPFAGMRFRGAGAVRFLVPMCRLFGLIVVPLHDLKFGTMKQYIVDAFTNKPFSGNPAAICVMERWPSGQFMQNLARENDLSETFLGVREPERGRSFGPTGSLFALWAACERTHRHQRRGDAWGRFAW